MNDAPARRLRRRALGLLFLTALTFAGLFLFLPSDLVLAMLVVAFVVLLYFAITVVVTGYRDIVPDWVRATPLWLVVAVPVVVGLSLLFRLWTDVTLFGAVFLLGMLFVFVYYWLLVPFALVQKTDQQRWDREHEVTEWPPVTVLIPAYKERGYITRTLDSLARTLYPAELELVVVDDGSLDGTYEEARDHPDTDAIVVQKENGGKHSALNRGLAEASHDIVVSIDADSWVAPSAITKIVEAFERNPDAAAVAGNVKVGNRNSFITRIQAFEYILGINTFRRAFDHVGLVSVVPGCLGAFRKETLEAVEGYSADTLTEDFDLTIEILKRGRSVHMSEGAVYTHAPTTWGGLYRQRLRWFRGHVQTIRKHRGVLTGTGYGLLQRLVFPYAVLSMSLFPLLGLAVLLVILLMLTTGQTVLLLQLSAFFLVLVVVLTLLAIEIDEEDRRLAVYAPLSVVGYKQFMDLVLLKSVVDVLSGRELRWTGAGDIDQSASGLVYDPAGPGRSSGPKPTFQLYEDGDGWRWLFRARSGLAVARSGASADTKEKAETSIDTLRKHARTAASDGGESMSGAVATGESVARLRFEVYEEEGVWRWRFGRTPERPIVRTTRRFTSEQAARRALRGVREQVPEATVTVLDAPPGRDS